MPTVYGDTGQSWRQYLRPRPYSHSTELGSEFEAAGAHAPKSGCGCASAAASSSGAGACQAMSVDAVPLLARHAGKGGPDLVMLWNGLGPRPDAVDVVVHLHGHAKCRSGQDPRHLDLCRDILPVSGLDLQGRQRPTLALLPRGNNNGGDGGTGYDFPALSAPGGLQKLVDFGLGMLQQAVHAPRLRLQRLILTAHSGGGADLQEILRGVDPHEVHIFDALYSLPSSNQGYLLALWAAKRIARDLAALQSGQPLAAYMAEQGGALRVISLTTNKRSALIAQALSQSIPAGSPLAKWYRVEYAGKDHCGIPRRYGWQLLANAAADLSGVSATAPSSRPAAPKTSHEFQVATAGAASLRGSIVEVAEREWQNWARGTISEASPAATRLLAEYYRTGVHQSPTAAQLQSVQWQESHPWSAVFVSYVMRQAGAGDSFGYSTAHTGYVAAAKQAAAKNDAAKFRAYRIDRAPLEAGDVVCHDRPNHKTGKCYGTTFDNTDAGGHSHGEIVLEVNAHDGYAITIGGNTSQAYPQKGLSGNTVGKHKIAIDSRGFVTPQGPCAFFAVLKPPADAPQTETGPLEYDSPRIALPSLASAKQDFSLREIAAGNAALPKEFLEAILVHAEADANNLTDRVFRHVYHPELSNRPLDPSDPKQAKLRAEWGAILQTKVGPLIWLRQVIDQLDRHRGSIPRHFLLGWMAVESDGKVGASSSRGERGYFQVDWMGGEAKDQLGLSRADFERLGVDRLFSIREGIELAERYRQHFLSLFPSVADGSDLLLRLTKGRHAAPAPLDKVLQAMVRAGQPIGWAAAAAQLPAFLVNNVNATLDLAAKLRPLADLVPLPSGPTPEFETAGWGGGAQPNTRRAASFLQWRRNEVDREGFTPVDPVPVIQLSRIQANPYHAVFTPGPAGFDALFCGDLPYPQLSVTIFGKVLAEDGGVQRPITTGDLRKWQVQDAVSRVYTGHGVSASSSPVARVEADGSFQAESAIVLDPGTRRIHIQVALERKNARPVTVEAVFQRLDLECFLGYVDSYEQQRPIGRVDGHCQVAAGHLEFLSSVRKMFQPPPKSSLKGLFDQFLHRNARICQLADPDSAQGKYIRSFENMQIGGETVDIGHVLVGIEASRRQKPDSTYPSLVDRTANTESLISWAGDLGSALEAYAEAVLVNRKSANLQDYLTHLAGRADLLGDIDGLNLGAIYDETKSLSANFRSYYEARPFRRFRAFFSSVLDDAGNPRFKLVRQNPPALDSHTRSEIAQSVRLFCSAAALKRTMNGTLTDTQANQIRTMCSEGTPEMNAVVDYFLNLLIGGLAKET